MARAVRPFIALVVAVAAFAPGAAHASGEPTIVSRSPNAGQRVRSAALTQIVATYDRDLSPHHLRVILRDNVNTLVTGSARIGGTESATGGYRSVIFEPDAPLAEAASPYLISVRVYAALPIDPAHDAWGFGIDDTAPPVPTIDRPVDGSINRDQPVVLAGTTEPGSTVFVSEGPDRIAEGSANTAGRFWIPLPYPPEDGVPHTVGAIAKDAAGNWSAGGSSVSFIHDSVTVVPHIDRPFEGQALPSSSVVVSGSAKAGSMVTIREGTTVVGTAATGPDRAWSATISFPEGTHVITATSFDGSVTDGPSRARTFRVDLTPPATPVIQVPSEGTVVAGSPVRIAGTAEPHALVVIRQNAIERGSATVAANGQWELLLEFADGPHQITAQAVDAATNTSGIATRSFAVDSLIPEHPVILLPEEGRFVRVNPVVVSGLSEPHARVDVEELGATIATTTAAGDGTWSVAIPMLDGTHVISAVSIDAANHRGPRSPDRHFALDTVVPPAPLITQPAEAATVSASNIVRVTGDAEPGATVRVFEGSTQLFSALAGGDGSWLGDATLPNGTHAIQAQATDPAGNIGPLSALRTFDVAVPVDTTPPPPPVIGAPTVDELVAGWVVIAGTAEPDATVRVFEGSTELGSTTARASGNWNLGVALPSGPHVIDANAMDRAGNVGTRSATRRFTVDAKRPTVAIDSPPYRTIFLPFETLVITGLADDDTRVARVEVEVYDLVLGRRAASGIATCDVGCGTTSIEWTAEIAVGRGAFRVLAFAVDSVGNRSKAAEGFVYQL